MHFGSHRKSMTLLWILRESFWKKMNTRGLRMELKTYFFFLSHLIYYFVNIDTEAYIICNIILLAHFVRIFVFVFFSFYNHSWHLNACISCWNIAQERFPRGNDLSFLQNSQHTHGQCFLRWPFPYIWHRVFIRAFHSTVAVDIIYWTLLWLYWQ